MQWKRIGLGVLAGIVVVVAGLLLFGKKTIKSDDLESKLADQVATAQGVKPSQVSVHCPGDIEAKKGNSFNCDASAKGVEATLAITLTDDDGGYRVTVNATP